MSRLGFREPSITEPAIFTHTPREICPSKFHNNSPIPHTQVRFASLFLPALSSEVVVTLLHNTFWSGGEPLFWSTFNSQQLHYTNLGKKRWEKKTEGKNKCARAYSSAELLVRSHFSNHCFVWLQCSARSGSRCCCCLLTAGVATSDDDDDGQWKREKRDQLIK